MVRLSEMRLGSQGVIVKIESKELEIALMGLGLVAGDRFEIAEQAPFGGPIALRLPGLKIALRKSDAQRVLVNPN
jgi:Fe2+ transport system protein FeoA